MYDAQQLLATIDANRWPILAGFGIMMVLQWIWLADCIRVAHRERVYSLPLFCTFFWFAHDTGCVARFHEWFVVYDHWYMKCFWFGLLTAAILELIFFAQVVKYGRTELAPDVGMRTFIVGLVVFQVFASLTWELLKYMFDDPLYQMAPSLTLVTYPVLGAALMLRRRSTAGQSVLMWAAFTGMTVAWYITTPVWLGEAFRSPQYLAAGLMAIVGGLVMTYLVSSRSQLFSPVAPGRPRADQLAGAA